VEYNYCCGGVILERVVANIHAACRNACPVAERAAIHAAVAQAAYRGKASITVIGNLEYQACGDKICFNPSSVPLSWTLSLRPLVLERPALSK